MKYWLPISGLVLAAALLGAGQLILTVKAHSEQRQERLDQELLEFHNGIRQECKYQFPHSIIERAKCYQKMIANV